MAGAFSAPDAMESVVTGVKLTNGSPLRNAGLNVLSAFPVTPTTRDFFGNGLPGDSLPDIGAHEFVDRPDIAVLGIQTPSVVVQGDIATVGVTVKNEGGFAQTFQVELAIGGGTTPGSVVSGPTSVTLAPGAATTVYFGYDSTGADAGQRALTASVTPVAGETDTADNSATATLVVEDERYDVAVTAVTTPLPIVAGDLKSVSVVVRNNGNRTAAADVTLSFTTDGGVTSTALGTFQVGPLAAGGSHTVVFDWATAGVTPSSVTLVADAALVAAGDPPVALTDAIPGDNTLSTIAPVEAIRHELAVPFVEVPASATVGTIVPVRVTIENRGNQSETFTVTLRDQLGWMVGSTGSLTLNAGALPTSTVVPFSWATAGLSAGSYSLTAIVTPTSGVEVSKASLPVMLNAASNKLTVSSISPNQFRPNTSYTVQIAGTGFVSGTKLKFISGSGPAPAFSNIKLVSGTTLTATVSVSGDAKNSAWDLLLTNPDGTTATLVRAVTVTK